MGTDTHDYLDSDHDTVGIEGDFDYLVGFLGGEWNTKVWTQKGDWSG